MLASLKRIKKLSLTRQPSRVSVKSESRYFQAMVAPKKNTVEKYEVAVLGDACVGKSSILRQVTEGYFSTTYTPTISDIFEVRLKRNGDAENALLTLYDTAGSLAFPAMTRVIVKKCNACVVVFSVANLDSLEAAKNKLYEIKNLRGKNFTCVLVGNKRDCGRIVTSEQGLRCAVQFQCSYIETSAKQGEGLNEIFDSVLKNIRLFNTLFNKSRTEQRVLRYRKLSKFQPPFIVSS